MKVNAAVNPEKASPFVIQQVDIGDPKDYEVLVRIHACSVCHTDEAERTQGLITAFPAILGHEGAGVVEKVGAKVTKAKVGDHVALTVPHCGACEACQRGEYTACTGLGLIAMGRDHARDLDGNHLDTLMCQGSFCELAVVHENSCIVVDKDLPFEIIAPIGCGFSTGAGTVLNFLKPTRHDTIAIFGCGSTGFASLMAAKIAGCKTIIAVGRSDEKLALAKELGATHVVNSKKIEQEKGHRVELTGFEAINGPYSYPVADEIRAITGGKGVDYAVVTAAVQSVINVAMYSIAKKGECCVSAAMPMMELPLQYMLNNDLKVSSCGLGCANKYEFFPYLIKCYRNGLFPIEKLIKCYNFKDINQAFQDMEDGTTIKPVLQW